MGGRGKRRERRTQRLKKEGEWKKRREENHPYHQTNLQVQVLDLEEDEGHTN